MLRVKLSRGVLYMTASAFSFSAMTLLVKLASERVPMGEVVLSRAVITLALSYLMVRRAGLDPWGNDRRRLLFRGALGFAGLSTYFVAVARLPIADATTIQQTVPLLTAPLAWWVLGERVGRSTLIALAFGVAGVLLIVHPSGNGLDPLGVAIAIASAMISAVAYVTVRQLARTEHPLVIVFYFPLIAAPLTIPWAAVQWVTPSATDLLILLAIGVVTQSGQVFLTMALAVEKVGRATSVNYLQIVFAMVWQLIVFGDPPTWATVAGALLIVTGTVAVASVGTAVRGMRPPTPPPPPA
jgi:drug/metabolite transporter (DMT)-like permease